MINFKNFFEYFIDIYSNFSSNMQIKQAYRSPIILDNSNNS